MLDNIADNSRQKSEKSIRWEAYAAHSYILEHFMENLSLDEVADHVSLSKNYLRIIYVEEYNQKWKDTLTECRMKYAADLLVKTRWSVKAIGIKSCYRNIPYFCHVFKAWSGMTPLEYRRKHGVTDSFSCDMIWE